MKDILKNRVCYIVFFLALSITVCFYFLPLDSFGSYNIYGEFKGVRPLMLAILLDLVFGLIVFSLAAAENKFIGMVLGVLTISAFPILSYFNVIQNYMNIPI